MESDDSSINEDMMKEPTSSPPAKHEPKAPLFRFMARMPWPFLFVIPIAFILLIAFGFSKEEIVEEHVANLWIPQRGTVGRNQEYMDSIGKTDFDSSTFAAMAIGRDGENILTAARLKEIRQRMEDVDAITVDYNGHTFGWDDLCASTGAPYELPCARLTALDVFQESRWEWDTLERSEWYQTLIFPLLIRPRIPRFGVMMNNCVSPAETNFCDRLVAYRTNPGALGREYEGIEPVPLRLFADLGNLEMSDPCRICIEEGYEATINGLYDSIVPSFGVLSQQLGLYSASLGNDPAKQAKVNETLSKTSQIAATVTRDDVEDFYFYYVTRGVYSQLGWSDFIKFYEGLVAACEAQGFPACPQSGVMTEEAARAALLAHADNTFSSVTTAGIALPFWSEGDGTGSLFGGGLAPGDNGPVSGSGIDMSGELTSLAVDYLDLPNIQTPESWNPAFGRGGAPDPNDPSWAELVEVNPIFAWFMAGVTDAEPGTVCGNGNLTGTSGLGEVDVSSAALVAPFSQRWCTPFDIPNEMTDDDSGPYTQQHFARMWYDLLINSGQFLGLVEGTDDPYTFTSGQGCGYELAEERYSYTNQTTKDILGNASREVYYVDEGESIGVVDPNLLMGGVVPAIGAFSSKNPLKKVTVLQTLYASLVPEGIVERVKHCKRPGGGIDITEDDAEEILKDFKEVFDDTWSKGWDDPNDGQIQFVNFVDDTGAIGSAGRMLRQITLDNSKLMAVSIIIIAVFSALFIFSFDWIESRVLVTLVGVGLVILSFFAAVGFGILVGIKVNVSIAWTLPFIIMGLGVDDVYIVLTSLRKAGGYEEKHWLEAMKDVVVPVTMTSLVNVCMMAILNVSDIPAVYLTAQVAAYSIIALYLSVILSFPAYCLLDFRRQKAGRLDVLCCFKSKNPGPRPEDDFRSVFLYDKIYRPIMLGQRTVRTISHVIVWAGSIALIAVGAYGISERDVGLGLEDFFPSDNQAGEWATLRTEELASWNVLMNWGALDYTHPHVQMKMIKQFEDVVASPHISEVDTKRLWMADFLVWTTRMCTDNFDREDFDSKACGRDIFHSESDSFCSGMWTENIFDLRMKDFTDPYAVNQTCVAYEQGICRPTEQMHPSDFADSGIRPFEGAGSFCPVVNGWSDEKWRFCLREWRNITGFSGGRFLFEDGTGTMDTECGGVKNNDEELQWPIPYTAGPTMFSFDLTTHELTLDMMEQTRAICDDDEDLHCWMTGIPFDYWSQYENIDTALLELCGYAVAIGFAISFVFLLGTFMKKRYLDPSYAERHATTSVVGGSLIGALLIAITIVASVVSVVGISILANVNLTGFSNMAFVLSVGFSTEYSVHVVDRWLLADMSFQSSLDRVQHTMELLTLPTFMSFVSSTIGVATIAFTEFDFTHVFFFRPLIITVLVTYWFGCWWLPACLSILDFDAVKLGDNTAEKTENAPAEYAKGVEAPASENFPPEEAQTKSGKDLYEEEQEEVGSEVRSEVQSEFTVEA